MIDCRHIGIHDSKIPDTIFLNLQKLIKNKKKLKGAQKTLVGNIVNEYHLDPVYPELEQFLTSQIANSPVFVKYLKRSTFLRLDARLYLHSLWVNFQKKTEFNPAHDHSGLFSFIIFMKIPYDLKEELEKGPGKQANSNLVSHLQFFYLDSLGGIKTQDIPVDKSYEGFIYIFPASMLHCVYPFYTSNNYRITVAGNIKLWNN